MAIDGSLTWGQATATVAVGDTVTVPIASDVAPTNNLSFSPAAEISSSTTTQVVLRGLSVGTKTIAKNTAWSEVSGGASWDMGTLNAFTLTVTAPVDDDSFLNKRGLTHFWENIDDIKQDKLTAGTGISITGNTISATGGGTADAVDWGHITGSMSNQTDLTTALAAKANSADLATVATSGDYDDLTDKPTIGNATLTIQKNGASAGTFTANATSNQTINITVPTTAADVSALPASTKYGASIAVSINTTDYKVTTTLKDQDGNTLGTAQVIDLPLESVVVNGSYDSTNKKIVLTLQNGNTIDIPVADLVAGLQSEITSTNKLASDLVDDTNQTHKFMTSAEKTKLSGIAAGAEVNVQSDWDQTTTTADDYIKNKPTIPTKTSDLTNDSNFVSDASYVHTDNNYTTTDKNKLASIAAGAEVNVQANWTQTTTTADDYIKNKPTLAAVATSGSYNDLSNKPTIPTVNNATLTIQKNGTTVNTFTANASSNVTANITVPINVSDLTNDAGYLTSVAWGDVTGKPTFATVATSGSYNDLSNKPTIPAAQVNSDWDAASGVAQILNKPTNVSAFANDAGYITSYTDNKVAQTNTNPTSETTYYPVASVSISTNTADVKKFSGFNLKYYNNEGGDAELVLGQNSYYSPIEGKLTLWNSAASQKTTTILSADGATINQLLYSPYTVDASGGRLIANSAYYTATGSATHPVYADAHGILQQTTYTLEKSVPSDAVFTDTTYSDATTSASGLMSAADKTKLNGIASGAEVNVQSDWAQTTATADDYIKNKPTLATVATSGSYNDLSNKPTIPTVDSSLSTSSTNAIQNKAVANALNEKVNVASVDLTGQTTTILAQVKALGTTQKNYGRFYSKTDGGSANISDKPTGTTNASFVCVAYQSRNNGASDYTYQLLCWTQADTNPYKATVTTASTSISWTRQQPTVNNGTLTIQKNGTNVQTFTANQSGNATANITVPTKTSDLTNDSGFLDSVAWGDVTGKPTFATVATSGSYNDLSNKPTIPAAQVQSNWTQTTTTAVDYIKNKPNLATVATSGSYNDLSNKPTIPTVNNATLTIQKNGTTVKTFTANASSNVTANITVPTKTSDITNDSGYLTSSGAVTSFNGSTGAVTYTAPVTSVNGNTGAVTISVPTKTSDLNNDSGFVTSPIQTSDINSSAVTADKIDWSTMVIVAPKVTSGTTMTLTIPAGTWKLSGCMFFVMSQNSSTYQNVGLVIGTDDRRQNTNFMVYSNAVRGNFTVIDTVTVTANTTVTLHGAGTLRYNSCSLIAERIG